jgi:hypothetical protein
MCKRIEVIFQLRNFPVGMVAQHIYVCNSCNYLLYLTFVQLILSDYCIKDLVMSFTMCVTALLVTLLLLTAVFIDLLSPCQFP